MSLQMSETIVLLALVLVVLVRIVRRLISLESPKGTHATPRAVMQMNLGYVERVQTKSQPPAWFLADNYEPRPEWDYLAPVWRDKPGTFSAWIAQEEERLREPALALRNSAPGLRPADRAYDRLRAA